MHDTDREITEEIINLTDRVRTLVSVLRRAFHFDTIQGAEAYLDVLEEAVEALYDTVGDL